MSLGTALWDKMNPPKGQKDKAPSNPKATVPADPGSTAGIIKAKVDKDKAALDSAGD